MKIALNKIKDIVIEIVSDPAVVVSGAGVVVVVFGAGVVVGLFKLLLASKLLLHSSLSQ